MAEPDDEQIRRALMARQAAFNDPNWRPNTWGVVDPGSQADFQSASGGARGYDPMVPVVTDDMRRAEEAARARMAPPEPPPVDSRLGLSWADLRKLLNHLGRP